MARRYGLDPGEIRKDPPAVGSSGITEAPRRRTRRSQQDDRRRTGGILTSKDESFHMDLESKVLEVWDRQDPRVRRVQLGVLRDVDGSYTVTDYGIKIWDQNGNLIFDESGAGTVRPILTVDVQQSGSTATVSVGVEDPELLATALEFSEKADEGPYAAWADTWDSSTGTLGVDTSLTRSEAITLVGKHNVSMKVRLQWTEEGGTQEEIYVVTMDADTVAEILSVVLYWDSTNAIKGYVLGDEDCDNIYLNVRAGADPGAPTSGSYDATVSGRYGSFTSSWTNEPHLPTYVNVRGYNGTDAGPNRLFIFHRTGTVYLPFHLELSRTQSGTTGTLTVDIDDPTKCISDVKFQKKEGTTDFGGSWITTWDSGYNDAPGRRPGTDTSLSFYENLALQLKHESAIKVQITYKDANGTTRYHEISTSFDANNQAEIQDAVWTITSDGSLRYSITADEDTAQVIANITVNSGPTQVTQANKDLTVTGNRGTGDTAIDLDWDDYAYISVGACKTAGGTPDTYQTYFVRRDTGSISKTRLIPLMGGCLMEQGSPANPIAYQGSGVASDHATNNCHFQVSLDWLPDGATIDQMRFYYEKDASGFISCLLKRITGTSATTVATFSFSTQTWAWGTPYNGDHTVDGSYAYYLDISMYNGGTAVDTAILYGEVTLIAADIDQTL